ncbi:MAG: ThiF family adenylyltransferase, partial [Desulfobacterales bacterium]
MRDPERLKLERTGVEELSRTAKWLVGTEWSIGEDGLGLDAVICAKGHDYEVRVSFPTLYPDVPIIVRPKKMQSRISSHQYGDADGPLCLEWGPDNWHRDVTSAQMLESAYRLFEIENPLGEDRPDVPIIAPSRHKLTIGQELRRKWIRWFVGKTLYDYLAGQPSHSIGTFKFSLRQTGEIWICTVHEAMPFGGSVWVDDQIPTTLAGESELKTGIWLKTVFDKSTIGNPKTLTELRVLFQGMEGEKFLSTDGSSPVDAFGKSISGILISDKDEELNLFIVFKDEGVLECSRVRPGKEPIEIRSPDWDDLNNKKIGIVGLGSVGSKIAISLARMGCRNFYLIDHDLLLPENLQRHAMDWQGVVQHKVDAMKFAIDLIAPGAKVGISRQHITGQESNAAINGALNRLTSCDVIIDATADSKIFNLLAAITRVTLRPLIWMEVYGGGLGGMVARSRPKIDPTPQDMRGAYLQYCTDNPSPDFKPTSINYAVED